MEIRFALIIGVVAVAGVIAVGMYVTDFTAYLGNNPTTCNNCHVMDAVYEGWYHSAHQQWAKCGDCHTPHALIPKYIVKAQSGFRHVSAFALAHIPDAIRARDGIAMTQDGILKPIYDWSKKVIIAGGEGPYKLSQIFGGSTAGKWAFIAALAVAILAAVWPERPLAIKKCKGYFWSVTGVLIGLISVLSLWASATFGDLNGSARGLSFTPPTRELFFTLFTGESRSTFFQNYALGNLKLTWVVIFIIAVPIGAYLSARGLKEFSWKTPRDPKELLAPHSPPGRAAS